MLQGEHSAILSTFIKLPLVILMIYVLSIFEWPFYTGFTVTCLMSVFVCEVIIYVKIVSQVFVDLLELKSV